jgi:hypothetical protein
MTFEEADERLTETRSSIGILAVRCRDLRKVLSGPPDTCGGERGRRISIAITHLETAELWLGAAGDL